MLICKGLYFVSTNISCCCKLFSEGDCSLSKGPPLLCSFPWQEIEDEPCREFMVLLPFDSNGAEISQVIHCLWLAAQMMFLIHIGAEVSPDCLHLGW